MAGVAQSTLAVPLDTVLQLLTGPDSKALALRHTAALECLARKNYAGFYMSDLEQVCSIMDVTIKAIKHGEHQFVSALCLLLRCGTYDHFGMPLRPFSASQRAHPLVNAGLWAFHYGKSLLRTKPP